MQHQAADELCTLQSRETLATMFIGAHREGHLRLADVPDALVANGRAVRVAAQILQHPRWPDQWGLGICHPLVAVQIAPALSPELSTYWRKSPGKVALSRA